MSAHSFQDLIGLLRRTLAALPDRRTGENCSYTMEDFGLSAFAVFFTQSPSFLAHQQAMQKARGVNNAQSVFGIQEIPCDNQVRGMLDPVPPQSLYPVYDRDLRRPPPRWHPGLLPGCPRLHTHRPGWHLVPFLPQDSLPVLLHPQECQWPDPLLSQRTDPRRGRTRPPRSHHLAPGVHHPPGWPHQTRLRDHRGQALVGAKHHPLSARNRHPLG